MIRIGQRVTIQNSTFKNCSLYGGHIKLAYLPTHKKTIGKKGVVVGKPIFSTGDLYEVQFEDQTYGAYCACELLTEPEDLELLI